MSPAIRPCKIMLPVPGSKYAYALLGRERIDSTTKIDNEIEEERRSPFKE